jgi:hypothetical protein
MKYSWLYCLSLSLAAGLLVGCGGGDSAEVVPEETVDVSVGQAEVKGKTSSGKRSVSTGGGGSGSNAAVQSALSKVEDALDAGNYSAAVDIVLKTRMDPADQRVAFGMVTDEITDAMARGDANAAKAYQTMNQVRLMRQGQR